MVFLFIAAGYCGIMSRLYYLQIAKGQEITQMAERMRERVDVVRARRGNITDSKGNLMAATRPVIELGVDPERYDPEVDDAKLEQLSALINVPVDRLRELCRKTAYEGSNPGEIRAVRWRKLADAISDLDYAKVREVGIKAVYGNRKYVRNYPSGAAAAHLLGYVNKEENSVMGVESEFDYYLRGQDGWRETELDARRHELVQFEKREVPARDGLNVELTIDLVIQDMIDREVAKLAKEYNPESVVIIVSDPKTGDILGLSNWPSFDPNEYWNFPMENLRNRAITDVYEPGSTFKIVPVAGALDKHLVTPNTLVDCSASAASYRGRMVNLPGESHGSLGTIPVTSVVSLSSNKGAAQLGMKLGEETFLDYVYKFGFGQKTDVFGPAEVVGIVHPIKKWDGLTISRMPMGQAVCVTAVQMHFGMCTVASEGVLMRPRIVKRVYDENGNTVFSFSTRERDRAISKEAADKLRIMLEGVARKGGTAPRAEIPGYEVAGKTGTSQKIENGHYSHSKHVATFTGFFPASDPKIAVTVVVDNGKRPDGGICYGGIVAAPAFKEVAQQIIQYLAIEPPEAGKNGMYVQANAGL
jgi:cell division protein FtsI (penicillin-binding protein 3)/stage V sporulation protein D (sporulation-specific penicillin-binding protein)